MAKFLGTPPICVFGATLRGGKLFIGESFVSDINLPDGEVTVAIRPEGFVINPQGAFECGVSGVEVMGRDTSIVALHPCCRDASFRVIVNSENLTEIRDTVRFDLKKNKMFLFDAQSGERIRF